MLQLKLNSTLTQTTQLEAKTTIGLFSLQLKEEEYKILKETNNTLVFYNNPWKLRWNFEPYIALDGGNIEIMTFDHDNSVCFNYYLDFFPWLLIVSSFIISLIVDKEYELAIGFTCFYFITSIIAIIRAKLAAKRILREVLNGIVVK